jgi:desulfoferrodoxin (superoxide reductase-like protein)
MKVMNGTWVLIALLVLVPATMVSAHPPKSVSLQWGTGGNLTVSVVHAVNDPAKHYIHKIVIYINDMIAGQKEYKSQQTPEGFSDTFLLGAKPSGTKIKAEAFCLIMGSAEGSVIVP